VGEQLRHVRHLVERFFASLFAREPVPADVARVRAILTPPEFAIWVTMPRPDRAESLATLRRLPPAVAADERWAAAALLHDAGKGSANLGTIGRALATARGHVGDPARVGGRAGRYLRHAEIGADLLRSAGARVEVVAWAASHHAPDRWPIASIPEAVCAALAAADGEAVSDRG
jgi:putative nucleotidyltransferase with HDIG domain